MSPIRTPHCNFTYTAPVGMTAEECGDLPCERDTPHDCVKSWWQPTAEERYSIAAGGLIRFTCHGTGHPAVALDVHSTDPDFIAPTASAQQALCTRFAVIARDERGQWAILSTHRTSGRSEWEAEHARNGRASGDTHRWDLTTAQSVPCEIRFNPTTPQA